MLGFKVLALLRCVIWLLLVETSDALTIDWNESDGAFFDLLSLNSFCKASKYAFSSDRKLRICSSVLASYLRNVLHGHNCNLDIKSC